MSYYLTNENSFLNINNAHLKVSGNVHADVMKIGAVEFAPIASNVTTTTNFTNVETGLTTSSNLHIGGTLTMGTVEVIATTHNLENTTTNGNITPHTVEFTNPTTSLVASGNVEVGGNATVSSNLTVSGFVGSSGTGALTLPSGTTGEQPSTGLVGGMIRFNSTLNRLEVYNGTVWQGLGGISATGGNVTTSGGYKIHTFTSDDTFEVVTGGSTEYIIVAGGGGGAGRDVGGGGGGGGVIIRNNAVLNTGSYNVVIGAGGVGGPDPGESSNSGFYTNTSGQKGYNTTFNSETSIGGGAGKNYGQITQDSGNGGSGGGGAGLDRTDHSTYPVNNHNAGAGTSGQGNNGGAGHRTSYYGGGGGGGAGGVGVGASVNPGGRAGGPGIEWPSGSGTYYAGGGGGTAHRAGPQGTHNGVGGSGGGGSANQSITTADRDGEDGKGGGGGASRAAVNDPNYGSASQATGGSGGDGIVIIRYLI